MYSIYIHVYNIVYIMRVRDVTLIAHIRIVKRISSVPSSATELIYF